MFTHLALAVIEPGADIEGQAMDPPKVGSRNWPRKVPRAPFTSLSVRKPKRPLDGLEGGRLAQWVKQRICAEEDQPS